jgi:hypothetical protein
VAYWAGQRLPHDTAARWPPDRCPGVTRSTARQMTRYGSGRVCAFPLACPLVAADGAPARISIVVVIRPFPGCRCYEPRAWRADHRPMTAGTTAISIQEYMAASVLHHDSPMDTAITTGTTAALIRDARTLAIQLE